MFRFLSISLLAFTLQQVNAGEIITEFSPSVHLEEGRSCKKMSESLPIEDTLKLSGPLNSFHLQQLKDKRYQHIIINGSYIDIDDLDWEFPLIISPELIHSSVKSLTVSGGRLDKDSNSFVRINEFNNLERLNLESNYITEENVNSIVLIPNLKYLSLAATHVSDEMVPLLLAISTLQELDISSNKDITDKSFDSIFNDDRLKRVNVSYTGMSIKNRGIIRKKYKPS